MYPLLMLGLAQIPLLTFVVILIRAMRSGSRQAIGQSFIWLGTYVITMSIFTTWMANSH